MKSAWDGEPIWPAELSAAVAERLVACKDQLVTFAVALPRRQLNFLLRATQAKSSAGNMVNIGLFLQLDPEILKALSWRHRRKAGKIAARTEKEIKRLLTRDQYEEFARVGICSLLARVSFPGHEVLVRRLNELPERSSGRDHSDRFCPKPFEYAEIGPGGKTHLCCPVMVPTEAGDSQTGETFMDVWNSESAQAVRESILNGSFSHCVESLCPELQNGTLVKRDEVRIPDHKDIIENHRTVLARGPREITLNYDQSCNLACPMCRTGKIIANGKEQAAIEKVQDWAIGEHLKDATRMIITTAGDGFGSRIYHKLLRNFDSSPYPNLRILILTNGLLLTAKTWDQVCNEIIDAVSVSVDAATTETYAVNRGGDFNLLRENLEFVKNLRQTRQLGHFGLHFTVQENNYAEMPAFVSLAKSVNADKVVFIQLVNGGTFTKKEYARRSIHDPSHPKHGDFLEVLKDPLLGLPMVDLQVLAPLRA